MGTTTIFKAIERRIRLSKSYHDWVTRNKAPACLCCGETSRLQCHHVIDLYHIIFGLWKLYGDAEKVYAHAIAMHDDDRCDSATLCDKCHAKRHPGRSSPPTSQIRIEPWTALPRNFKVHFCQSNASKPAGHLGLIGFQTLLGIGWYILNGHLDARMLKFNRRRFAELIEKTPSSSFNRSLDAALVDLKVAGVLLGTHRSYNDVELHLSEEYLDMMNENPWFMSLDDAKTSKPCVLALKWFLGMQSKKTIYRISLEKLMVHIGIQTVAPQMAVKAIRRACKGISWVGVSVDKGMCTFALKRRGSMPVLSLRQVLNDAISNGR
jgi:hypothetical protein